MVDYLLKRWERCAPRLTYAWRPRGLQMGGRGRTIEAGQIVLVQSPLEIGRLVVKRVTGLPGDSISVSLGVLLLLLTFSRAASVGFNRHPAMVEVLLSSFTRHVGWLSQKAMSDTKPEGQKQKTSNPKSGKNDKAQADGGDQGFSRRHQIIFRGRSRCRVTAKEGDSQVVKVAEKGTALVVW